MAMIHIPMCFVVFDDWKGEVKNRKIKGVCGCGCSFPEWGE